MALTYQNETAEPYVRPLAEQINAALIMPLNVQNDTQMKALFDVIKLKWGQLDFFLHAVAFAPKVDLHGRVIDCFREKFLTAMDISCYSFLNLARLAEPLMTNGGTMLTTTYLGGERVVQHYGVMGPVKAALDGVVKYLAAEMGEKKIRVNALSPGPIATRAGSGILDFDSLIKISQQESPEYEGISTEGVGSYARFLASDEARLITGSIAYIVAGFNIMPV